MRNRIAKAIGILLLSTMALMATSCALVDESRVQQDDSERIPWNTRANWEGSTLGVPQ